MEFISLKSIINDYYSNTGRSAEVDESSLLQWASDALGLIGAYRQFEYHIVALTVENFKVFLPPNFVAINQIAYNATKKECSKDILERVANSYFSYSIVPTKFEEKECCTQVAKSTEDNMPCVWEIQIPSTVSGEYDADFKPLFLCDHSFKNIEYHLTNCINKNKTAVKKIWREAPCYSIDRDMIITSFKTGTLLLSYLATPSDEEGYPMLPKIEEYVNALYHYIEYRLAWKEYTATKSAQDRLFYNEAEKQKAKAMAQAKTRANTLTTEEMESMMRWWGDIIPQKNKYLNFYRNLDNYVVHYARATAK